MDPDPRKEIEVDPDPDLDPERGLKWIRIRPNAVDPNPDRNAALDYTIPSLYPSQPLCLSSYILSLITTSLFFYGYVCGPILLFPIQAADLDNVLLFLNNSAYLSICPFYLFIYTHLCIRMFFYLAISSYVHLSVYLRTRTRWLISIIQYYLPIYLYP